MSMNEGEFLGIKHEDLPNHPEENVRHKAVLFERAAESYLEAFITANLKPGVTPEQLTEKFMDEVARMIDPRDVQFRASKRINP